MKKKIVENIDQMKRQETNNWKYNNTLDLEQI